EQTYWLADLHVHWSLAHDEVHGFLGERSSLFAFPIREVRRYRLIGQQDGAAGGDPTLADLQRLMDTLGPMGTVLSDPVWLTAFHLHHRKVDRYGVGNAFVAGDAAHIHSPAGGQGMNTGIQDVDNLAWKLALVAHGKADRALLASYDAERNPVAARVLRQTDLMFRVLINQSPIVRALRNRLVPLLMSRRVFVRMMQRSIGELDIRYRTSPIVAEDGRRGGPHTGTRAPDGPLITPTGEKTSVWALSPHERMPQHTLLLLSGPHPSPTDRAAFTEIRQIVEEHYRDLVATHLIVTGGAMGHDPDWEAIRYDDPDQAIHRRYGTKGATLFLIRPDGYIGFRSRPANADATRAYLARIFPSVSA
ncbi:MAG: FAD-dependent monooxygenase, partial [Thermomicrobiales bacterium]